MDFKKYQKYRWIAFIIASFLLTRFLLLAVGFFSHNMMLENNDKPSDVYHYSQNRLIDMWCRWDCRYYISIATSGYSSPYVPGSDSNYPFSPLFPMIASIFGLLFSFPLAGILVSNTCLFLSLIFLYKLVMIDHSEKAAELSVLFLLVFPTSFFLSSVYSESTFLLFTIAAFYYARKGNFILAGVMGAFSSIARIIGVFIIIPLAIEYFSQNKGKLNFVRMLPFAMIPIPLLIFFYHQFTITGNFFIFFLRQADWGRGSLSLVSAIASVITNPSNYGVIDLMFALLGLVMVIFAFFRIRKSYFTFMVYTWLIPILSGIILGMSRYVLVMFPIYLLMAQFAEKRDDLKLAILFCSTMFLSYFMILFSTWYWVA
jgi:Gpi18-like mannosyltransferase